jgi:hypothetical protein
MTTGCKSYLKIIENVTLTEIRGKHFYDQKFEWKKHHPTQGTSIRLSGWDRVSNARVGMFGYLEYVSTSGYGLWFFRPSATGKP